MTAWNRSLRAATVCLALLAGLGPKAGAEPFLREDWVYEIEPTATDHWGINRWGLTSFALPPRAMQRGKRELESRYADNWRFGSATGGAPGVLMRVASSFVDMALFLGPQNFDHVLGHDSRSREIVRDYPGSFRFFRWRFNQILPVYFGGKELDSQSDFSTNGKGGADHNTLTNSTLWEMHNQFVYTYAKEIMAGGEANSAQVLNLVLHRVNMLQMDWKPAEQACVGAHLGTGRGNFPGCFGGEGSARDYSNFVMDLNSGRYGVANVNEYRLKIADLQQAVLLQLLDPVFAAAAYRYGADYLGRAKNRSSIPMIRVPGTGVSYLPGLRVDLSPFGIEFFQDNYFRYKRTIANLYWTRGDNAFERRLGAGLDVENIPVWRDVTAGVYGMVAKQPHVSRIVDTTALTPEEFGMLHNAYNYGASLRIPLYSFGDKKDPKQFLITLKVGRKNTGWFPGEYIKGSTYAATGIGFHL